MKLSNLVTGRNQSSISMKERQQPLIEIYKSDHNAAMVIDRARTSSDWADLSNPLVTKLLIDKSQEPIDVGVHKAVGGESDNPTPGDILCGALAACLDSTIRIIANRFDLKLRRLNIEVKGKVDIRGTLRVSPKVPVAFQSFEVIVDIKPATFVPSKFVDRLIAGAEQSCVVMQSLKPGCEIIVRRK